MMNANCKLLYMKNNFTHFIQSNDNLMTNNLVIFNHFCVI